MNSTSTSKSISNSNSISNSLHHYPITAVSGFWLVKNKHGSNYLNWFKNSLSILCPYVFFGNHESLKIIKHFREKIPIPTYYIECEISDFYTYPYKNRMITDPVHCPSVELNLIWHEKIFFIEKARNVNPFQSDYFIWIDSGISNFRNRFPPKRLFPNMKKLFSLPKNKFIFTSSEKKYFNKILLNKPNYHFISGTYLLHESLVEKMVELYKLKMAQILADDKIYTDQIILTHIMNDTPDLFFRIGDGYGKIIELLY